MYLALTDKLVRYKFRNGEESPGNEPEVLATYPDYGLNYKYGGWHLTRTIVFGQGDNRDKLYVSVGSSCNACDEKEEIRATLSVMDADGKNARIIGLGLRNAVGLRVVEGALYLTNMGADHLGDDAPDDTMFVEDKSALQGRRKQIMAAVLLSRTRQGYRGSSIRRFCAQGRLRGCASAVCDFCRS
jgi:glucose/arabinose dehydrogenase